MVFSCACGADSVGDAGSAGEAGSTGLVPLLMRVLLASDCDVGSAGFCW